MGKRSRSTLDGRDKRVAEWYILNNCEEAAQDLNYFSNSVRSANPSMSGSEVDQFTNSEFPKWLRSYFVENPSDPNEVAWSLSYGAAISVTRKGDHSTMRRLIATSGKKVVPPIHQSGAPEILRQGSFGSVLTASDLSLIMR
ncbi:hypothetical protein K1719_011943 [Acacia pycnantha]|nr:hypothetical protein K1719_011943 [Acacia pycnantha]